MRSGGRILSNFDTSYFFANQSTSSAAARSLLPGMAVRQRVCRRGENRRVLAGERHAAEGESGTDRAMGRTGAKQVGKKAKAVETENAVGTGETKFPADWLAGLKIAIGEQMQSKCSEVAKTLVQQASEGNATSLRLMVQLRNMEQDAGGSAGAGFSQAGEWNGEAEWRGELCEATVNLRSGGTEPEG